MKSALIRVLFLLFAIGVFGDAKKAETVSVIEGDSVTLHTGVKLFELQSTDDVEWRLNGNRIAVISNGSISPSVAFRDGLQLDRQTGDLKITNIRTTDSGEYKLNIIRTSVSSEIFSVSVVSVDDKQPSVLMGEYVTLPAGVTKTEMYNVIQWRFGEQKTLIAKLIMKTGDVSTYDGPDGIFKGRLQLDYWSGSLTITNTRTEHTGVYEVDLISSNYTIHKTFSVTVRGEIQSVPVNEGELTTLNTNVRLMKYDSVLWMFGDSVIVVIQNNIQITNLDERFIGRLKLDHQTGSLNITNTRTTDSGLYDVKISSSKQIIHKKFSVTVTVTDSRLSPGVKAGIVLIVIAVVAIVVGIFYWLQYRSKRIFLENLTYECFPKEVVKGNDVILNADVTDVKRGDVILWIFVAQDGKHPIAQMSGMISTNSICHISDGRFKDRLKLEKNGNLIIKNTGTEHTGVYEVKMMLGRKSILKSFKVNVSDSTANGREETTSLIK